jgi:hypothetical protein
MCNKAITGTEQKHDCGIQQCASNGLYKEINTVVSEVHPEFSDEFSQQIMLTYHFLPTNIFSLLETPA